MTRTSTALVAGLAISCLLLTPSAFAQQHGGAGPCRADAVTAHDRKAVVACLLQHQNQLSGDCKAMIAKRLHPSDAKPD